MPPPPAIGNAATRAIDVLPGAVERRHAERRLPRRHPARLWSVRVGLPDLAMLCVASLLAVLGPNAPRVTGENWALALVYPPLVLALMRLRRSPDERLSASAIDAGGNVLFVVSLAAMLMIAGDSIIGHAHPAEIALRLWLFALVLLGSTRMLITSGRRRARRTGALATPTLIVGAGLVAEHVVRRLTEWPEYGLHPVGLLDADPPPSAGGGAHGVPLLGAPEELVEIALLTGARHVIVAFSAERDGTLVAVVRRCHELGLAVSLVPRLYESMNERTTLDHVGGLPLLTLGQIDPKGWQFAVKHAVDRLVALLALVALSPALLGLALAVRVTSPGPVLFRQRRVGRDGRIFDLLKFRTMRESDEPQTFVPANGFAPGGIEGPDRRTAVGRWLRDTSLDELPQLFNVLRGEMSLVGPRPERPEFVDQFAREISRYEDRHQVKSGITGWAQVHGLRGQTSISDRAEWDNFYVRNWSPALDLRILALTAAEVLRFQEHG